MTRSRHEEPGPADGVKNVAQAPATAPPGNAESLRVALMALTVVTWLVDAVSFLGLGRVFTANMTGNVVFLGFAAAGAPGLSVSRSLASLIALLFGALVGGRLGVAMA